MSSKRTRKRNQGAALRGIGRGKGIDYPKKAECWGEAPEAKEVYHAAEFNCENWYLIFRSPEDQMLTFSSS